ncbi:MAG: DUF4435 domain-containing protein [Methylococcales bacterium]|nr:DUF4435 domain-containing protein [Methylococcales bacterium]
MTPFENYALDSERRNAFNRTQQKSKPAEILVYVEGFSDVGFWHGILSPYEKQNNIKFDISPYSENNLTTGKDKLIKLFSQTAQNFIICLDSDYDYLLKSKIANQINHNPYIFQTYAYAIENLKCYAESLNSLCIRATNNTDDTVNLAEFLKDYSGIIYNFLVCNLYYYSIGDESTFSRDEFGKIVTFGDKKPKDYTINSNNWKEKINLIEKSISEKSKTLIDKDIPIEFSKQLDELGLNRENAYLFMRGHNLYDFISKFLVVICNTLKNQYEEYITTLAKDEAELKTNKGGLHNSSTHVTCLLANNDKFKGCNLYQKIEDDIQAYLEILKTSETHV